MKFTERQIKNLKPEEKRYEAWEGNGLGIRIAPSGHKSWIYMYRFNGRSRRMTLGIYPVMTVATAHAVHGKAILDLANGIDPGKKLVNQHQEHRNAATLNEFALEYIDKWAKKHKRSWKEDERMLNKDVLPKLGTLKAKDVSRRDIIKLLDEISERAPIVANRTFEVIRKMFNFAVERGIIDVSPCLNIRAPSKEKRRERMLTEDEITTFWHSLNNASMSEATRIALRVQLITAQRRGEVAQMEWSEVDMRTRWWTIPAIKAKNNLTHRVPLSDIAISFLNTAKNISDESKFVFPSPSGDKCMAPGAVTRAIGKNRAQFEIEPFTPHDLRRTAASHMTRIGISRLVVSKILNHMDSGVTAVYDRHSYDAEKREALDKWAENLMEIIASKPDETSAQKKEVSQDNEYSIDKWCDSDELDVQQAVRRSRLNFLFEDNSSIRIWISELTSFLDRNRQNEHVKYEVDDMLIEPDDDVEMLIDLYDANVRPSFKDKKKMSIYDLLSLLAIESSKTGSYRLAVKAFNSASALGCGVVRKQISGNKSGKSRAKGLPERNSKICKAATERFSQGDELKAILIDFASGHKLTTRTVRKILKEGGVIQ